MNMKILNKLSISVRFGLRFVLLLGVLFMTACNKEFPFRIDLDNQKPDSDREIRATSYKVAYLVLEDGIGTIVSREASGAGVMPTLAELSGSAIVSWNGVSAVNKEELTSYADLLTGVGFDKHGVEEGNQNNNLDQYPNIFQRISDYLEGGMRTAFISSNTELSHLVKEQDVDRYALESDDESVTAKVIEELEEDDSGLIFATFKETKTVGEEKGYDSDEYIQALASFDQKLKSITEAIQSREQYDNERWLIVVTSTKGGSYALPPSQDDGSVYSDTERNNFVVVSNKEFARRSIERVEMEDPAWTIPAVRYTGSGGQAVVDANKAGIYNIEKEKEYTLQLKVKIHGHGKQNQTIFSKRSNTGSAEDGWGFLIGQNSDGISKGDFRFKISGTQITAGGAIDTETWYSIIVRIHREDDKQYATIFKNGEKYGSAEITGAKGVDDSQPLRLGYSPGWSAAVGDQVHTIADVRIYNVAKSEEEIQSSYCSTLSTPLSDPYHDDLIGYWPGDDDGSLLKDRSPSGLDFTLTGSYQWTELNDRGGAICPTPPDDLDRQVMRSVDIPRMIYNWVGVTGTDEFGLDSQIWNPVFKN